MSEFLMFWLAKPLAEFGIFLLIVVFFMLFSLPGAIRQSRCKHERSVSETSACDAICNDCGKNLGFIGAWRKKQAAKEPQ